MRRLVSYLGCDRFPVSPGSRAVVNSHLFIRPLITALTTVDEVCYRVIYTGSRFNEQFG